MHAVDRLPGRYIFWKQARAGITFVSSTIGAKRCRWHGAYGAMVASVIHSKKEISGSWNEEFCTVFTNKYRYHCHNLGIEQTANKWHWSMTLLHAHSKILILSIVVESQNFCWRKVLLFTVHNGFKTLLWALSSLLEDFYKNCNNKRILIRIFLIAQRAIPQHF